MRNVTRGDRTFRFGVQNVAFIIIAINVLLFLLTRSAPRVLGYLAMNPLLVVQRRAVWQLVTYMFVHANFTHLFFNMLGLFFFGIQVEKRMGGKEFLWFYLISGIGAGLISFIIYWFSGAQTVFLLGSSGAVYAILLAYATFFPRSLIYFMGFIPVRAPILVIGYTLIELFSQIFNVRGGVAHLTHLAGFFVAFSYLNLRFNINPIKVFIEARR
jgi:membrane associated rhomboid family serine protease